MERASHAELDQIRRKTDSPRASSRSFRHGSASLGQDASPRSPCYGSVQLFGRQSFQLMPIKRSNNLSPQKRDQRQLTLLAIHSAIQHDL
jgi:hypothetical protein